MTTHPQTKIIAFVGLPGVGKSSAVDYLAHKGYPKVYFGGIVLDAMTKAGLEHTQKMKNRFERRSASKKVMTLLLIVSLSKSTVLSMLVNTHRIIADGLYTWTEYKILKREFPGELTTVAIVAPKHIRHQRLAIVQFAH